MLSLGYKSFLLKIVFSISLFNSLHNWLLTTGFSILLAHNPSAMRDLDISFVVGFYSIIRLKVCLLIIEHTYFPRIPLRPISFWMLHFVIYFLGIIMNLNVLQ